MLAIAISSGFIVCKALKTGQIWSATVAVGINRMASRVSAPSQYWVTVGLCALCCIVGVIVVIAALREIVAGQKRKKEAIAAEEQT